MIGLACAAVAFALAGNASAQAAADFAAAEVRFKSWGSPIEQIPADANGVHATSRITMVQRAVQAPEFLAQHGYRDSGESTFHGSLCAATAVVIGTARHQVSALSFAHTQIFTRTEFSHLTILHAKPGVKLSAHIAVVGDLGKIWIAGEQYSISDPAQPVYRRGSRYLLWLTADPTRPNLFYSFLNTTEVRRNGELYPVLDFSPAPTVAQLKTQIGRINNIEPCP